MPLQSPPPLLLPCESTLLCMASIQHREPPETEADNIRAFGITSSTVGIQQVMVHFRVSMPVAVLGLSLFLFGVAFAPIIAPHLSERFGRSPVYLVSLPLFALFIVGAGASNTFASFLVCRLFAGLCGGPCLVLIEGTFADGKRSSKPRLASQGDVKAQAPEEGKSANRETLSSLDSQ